MSINYVQSQIVRGTGTTTMTCTAMSTAGDLIIFYTPYWMAAPAVSDSLGTVYQLFGGDSYFVGVVPQSGTNTLTAIAPPGTNVYQFVEYTLPAYYTLQAQVTEAVSQSVDTYYDEAGLSILAIVTPPGPYQNITEMTTVVLAGIFNDGTPTFSSLVLNPSSVDGSERGTLTTNTDGYGIFDYYQFGTSGRIGTSISAGYDGTVTFSGSLGVIGSTAYSITITEYDSAPFAASGGGADWDGGLSG